MERLPHLFLPVIVKGLAKKKRKGFTKPKKERNDSERASFGKKVLDETDKLIEDFSKWKDKYGNNIDPALIFKIEANSAISEKDLERMGLKILGVDYKDAVVVFANDSHLTEFKRMIQEYSNEIPSDQKGAKQAFIHAFEDVRIITPEEKKGIRLQKEPIRDGETAILDIELWHLGIKHRPQMLIWKQGIEGMLKERNGKITDYYPGRTIFIIRAEVPSAILDDILKLGQVSKVDRKPKTTIDIAKVKAFSMDEVGDIPPPGDNAPGILIVDSGVMSGHPLLKSAMGEAQSYVSGKSPVDEEGHGTAVAGIALYGDLQQFKAMKFNPELWIYSARMFDEKGEYDTEILLENRLLEAIKYFIINNDNNIRVVNLSIGDIEKVYKSGEYQFRLAAFIDEIAMDYKDKNILFVISAGNFVDGETETESLDEETGKGYPVYLWNDPRLKIIDPATSALALTVGSLSLGQGSAHRWFSRTLAGHESFPSPFTRTGPSINGMIKPDIVEFGGDLSIERGSGIVVDPSIGIITTEKDFPTEGLFRIVNGTSFSAAKVSHLAANLFKELPPASSNLIKALLVASANIPDSRPPPLDKLDIKNGQSDDHSTLFNIYGYGLPQINRAFPDINRVLLVDENTIKLDDVVIYDIPIPIEFFNSGSGRKLSVTLAFDPPTRMTRKQYLGATMKFHLFKDVDVEQIKQKYAEMDENDFVEENVPTLLQKYEIKLIPGANLVNKGTVQKRMWIIDRTPQINSESLKLVVVCNNKWIEDEEYKQSYAVVVTVEQRERVELYNKIKERIRQKERIKV
ncbi:MAG: S8 family peptidase [Candidatus Methanoperedens sp.]|nr:S8 family peptidase [Candidatus Methanoperedens sp.]